MPQSKSVSRLPWFESWNVPGYFAWLSANKYGVVLGTLLVYLPFAAFSHFPGNRLFGNMFADYTFSELAFVTFAMLISVWSLLLTQGLIFQGMLSSPDHSEQYAISKKLQAGSRGGGILSFLARLLSIPIGWFSFCLFSLLALPGMITITLLAAESWPLRLLAVVFGMALAVVLLIAGQIPTRLAAGYSPFAFVEFPSQESLQRGFVKRLRRSFQWTYQKMSDILLGWGWLHLRQGQEDRQEGADRIHPMHFYASTVVTITWITLVALFTLVEPQSRYADWLPVAFYLYLLLVLFIWVFAALQFHLGRLRISPLLALLVWILFVGWWGEPHVYTGFEDETNTELSAHDVAYDENADRGSLAGNLVVVTATGGGIRAAGWTTLALEHLIEGWPGKPGRTELRNEIRLISSVSGGSVGAAHFVYGLKRGRPLAEIRKKSMVSALRAIAYGLSFYDLPTLLIPSPLYLFKGDRGWLMENEWAAIAEAIPDGEGHLEPVYRDFVRHPRLSEFREAIKSQALPAVIFNATALESGRRVMVTPISPWGVRDTAPYGEDQQRAETLGEYLKLPEEDFTIWTAARLSATFPYVSPAARYNHQDRQVPSCTKGSLDCGVTHHMIDGGYYDNFGVASALDWLDDILKSPKRSRFKRIAIVQIRASPSRHPLTRAPAGNLKAALIGPLMGLLQSWDSSASERNRIQVADSMDRWRSEMGPCVIETFVFEPAEESEGPLSWQLSRAEIRSLQDQWMENSNLRKEFDRLNQFLNQADSSAGCGSG